MIVIFIGTKGVKNKKIKVTRISVVFQHTTERFFEASNIGGSSENSVVIRLPHI